MIYVISEDNYFALGIMVILKEANIDVNHIDIQGFSQLQGNVGHSDIILLCAQSSKNSQDLSRLARSTDGKVIFFIDTISERKAFNFLHKGVISKKSPKEELITFITALSGMNRMNAVFLSRQETMVMDLLAQQQNACRIARQLKLSEKTVCAHKANALRKLGLNHLNARSVLLYERIFQTRV